MYVQWRNFLILLSCSVRNLNWQVPKNWILKILACHHHHAIVSFFSNISKSSGAILPLWKLIGSKEPIEAIIKEPLLGPSALCHLKWWNSQSNGPQYDALYTPKSFAFLSFSRFDQSKGLSSYVQITFNYVYKKGGSVIPLMYLEQF